MDIIGINVTKLTTAHVTNSFNIDGYELFRDDRKRVGKKPGGGCTLYVKDNVTFHEKTRTDSTRYGRYMWICYFSK